MSPRRRLPSILAIALVCAPFGQAGTVVPIPATPGVPVDSRFTLKVDGKDVFVGEEVSNGKQYSVACFDMEGTVTIEATASGAYSTYEVMPDRLGITAQKSGNTLAFDLSAPKKVVVRVDGIGYLLLLATPLETNVPSPGDPGVHYYGPGTHNVGRLKVGSNETVYIAGGARFVGTIEGEEVENVRVSGRGVLDGSVHTTWADRIFALVFDRSRNIRVEGIRIREAYWWVTEFLLCENVEIEHLFIFSNHRNNGGIMADGCNELTVRESFFITDDDCICPHALNAAGNGEPVGNHFLFEDCVLWQTGSGNCIRIGASFETSEVINCTFRRIDCIAHTGAAIYADHSDWATVRNLRFIDFHDEQSTGWTVNMFIKKTGYSCSTGYRDERGNFDGLHFVNLSSPGGGIRLAGFDATHKFNDVRFYNCRIGSNVIDSAADLAINSYVTDLHFVTDGSEPAPLEVDPTPLPAAASPQEMIIDNTSPQFRGVGFDLDDASPTSFGGNVHTATVPSGFSNFKAAIYEPSIKGEYDVYLHWGDYAGKAVNARWTVHHTGGYTTYYLDQNSSPGWQFHGRYTMDASSFVRLALPGYFSIASAPVMADAVKFVVAEGDPPPPPPPPPPVPASLNLSPSGDSILRSGSGMAETNFGTNPLLLVGDTATVNDYLRTVLAFDLSAPVLAGATITNATLTLTIQSLDTSGGGSGDTPDSINLHQLASSFTENGVTWNSRDGTSNWATPGGELGPLLASIGSNAGKVSPGDALVFSGEDLTAAVQSAIGGPLRLIGKLASEDANRGVFRFAARDNGNAAWHPVLAISYTIPDPFQSLRLDLINDPMADELLFSWRSRSGFVYDLLGSTGLDTPPSIPWPVYGSHQNMPADPSGTNTLTIPLPPDPAHFFAVQERPSS